MLNILLGPPGTGKTETCLRTVERYLEQGVPPDRIGYFAFTRRANQEAKERAISRFKLSSDDLPYFKTLHSLAFSRVGISKNQLMTEEDYQEIAKWLKVRPFHVSKDSLDIGHGDKMLELINIARVTKRPLEKIYAGSTVRHHVDWSMLEYVDRGIRHYKQVRDRHDYTDLLDGFVRAELAPNLEVLIVDEAQDLSALQWQMVDIMARRAKHTYIAGDDDQAIYRWAGADVEQFIHKEGQVHVLDQSYRIPFSHHSISQKLIHRIVDRRAKEFRPRAEQGTVRWHRHSEAVDISEGNWLLLARTRAGASQLEQEVRMRGYRYLYDGGNATDDRALQAVADWEALRTKPCRLSAQEVRRIYSFMTSSAVEHAHRLLANVENDNYLSLDDLLKNHGLKTTAPWNVALSKISEQQKRYISACIRKGEAPDQAPRITISTIHRAKGAQADNVLMLTDKPRTKTMLWRQEEYDDEARVAYVGLTRAKNALHLVHPTKNAGYSIPHADPCSAPV